MRSTASVPAPSASTPARDGGALETVDRRAYDEYTSALAGGRRATLAKDWAAAKAAFDAALRLRPHDARALAEKGYAELLAGETDAARSDLEAARWTDDKALAAQAWFNLGLLDDAPDGGDGGTALEDFWFSNQLRPTAEARAKIAGRAVCPVTVDTKRVAATHVSSWLAVAHLIQRGARNGCTAATTEADAKGLAETPGLPVTGQGTFHVVRSGNLELGGCIVNVAHVVQVRGADFWVYPEVGTGTIVWSMATQPAVALAALGGRVRATSTASWPQETVMCTGGDAADEIFECKGDPGEVPAGVAHPQSRPDYGDFLYDPATHELVLRVDDHASGRFASFGDGGRPIELRPAGDAVLVWGLGCARTIAVR